MENLESTTQDTAPEELTAEEYNDLLDIDRELIRSIQHEFPGELSVADWDYHYSMCDTAMHVASERGLIDMVQLLLSRGSQAYRISNSFGLDYPIHIASLHGYVDIVRLLYPISPRTSSCGYTILHAAADGGHVDVIQAILDFGDISIDCIDNEGWTPLHYTASRCRLEAMNYLFERGSKSINDKVMNGNLFHLCVDGNNQRAPMMLDRLFELNPEGITALNCHGWTPLHMAASQSNAPAVEKILMLSPESLNLENILKQTALHIAVRCGIDHVEAGDEFPGIPWDNSFHRVVEALKACGGTASIENMNPQQMVELNQPIPEETILSIRGRVYFQGSLTRKLLRLC